MDSEAIRIGQIVKPHGVEGAVLVEVLTDFPGERFAEGNKVQALTEDGPREFTVERGSPHQQRWLTKFREINDRDRAEELRGTDLVIEEEDVIGGEGDLYDFDLVGMEVFNQDGEPMGVVKDIGVGGNGATLRIERSDGDILEFPAHEDLVIDADRHEKWIKLRFPDGWEQLIES